MEPGLRYRGDGESVLHWAASNRDDTDIVDALLDAGANINAPGGVICHGTPLMNSVYFGLERPAGRLLQRGAAITNLISAAGTGRVDLIASWYRESGSYLQDAVRIDPEKPSAGEALLKPAEAEHWTYRAMIAALMCEQYQVADWLIDHDFDLDLIPDGADWSCLHHAAYCGSLPMAMYLVARGADLEKREQHGATPADYAGAHGHPDVMHYLIDQGTVLSIDQAVTMGRLDKVLGFIDDRTDTAELLHKTIGTKTVIGKPVHPDITRGRIAIAKYLLQREPELCHRRIDGQSARDIAEAADDQDWLVYALKQ